jgi:hypothetical protein
MKKLLKKDVREWSGRMWNILITALCYCQQAKKKKFLRSPHEIFLII